MSKRTSKSQFSKKDRTNNDKGTLLEQIVAMLHKEEGVKVDTNVFLTPLSGDETRKREIDVLLTSEVAGYLIRIAIQCKNYSKSITVGQVGEFKDLLEDVGIPYQHGIIVSINGFQSGAEKRAKELGIKTFILEGLDESRLSAAVKDTFQFFVHLLLIVEELRIESEIMDSSCVFSFFDYEGRFCGFFTDLIVSSWRNNEIPMTLGQYTLDLFLPEGWSLIYEGKASRPSKLTAKVRVIGYLAEMGGKLKEYKLKETDTNKTAKLHIQADFDTLNNLIKYSREEPILSEDELRSLKKDAIASIEHRIKLPKIFFNRHLQPFSEKLFNYIKDEVENLSLKEVNNLPEIDFEEIEGNIFVSMFDKAAMGEPVIVAHEEGKIVDVRLLAHKDRFGEIVEMLPLLRKYPRKDFAVYLVDALIIEGEKVLRKSFSEQKPIKSILENQAFNMFDKAISISPIPLDTYYSLGKVYSEYNLFDKAYDKLRLVASSKPENASIQYALAETLFKMEKFTDALDVLNKATENILEIPMTFPILRAKIFERLERYKESTDDLIRIWHIDYKILTENQSCRVLVHDVFNKFSVLALAIIMADIQLFYSLHFAEKNTFEESKKHLNFAISLIEDIFNSIIEDSYKDFNENSFSPLLDRAIKSIVIINDFYSTKYWKEKLDRLEMSKL